VAVFVSVPVPGFVAYVQVYARSTESFAASELGTGSVMTQFGVALPPLMASVTLVIGTATLLGLAMWIVPDTVQSESVDVALAVTV
jgi:hypothetical protein